MAKSGRRNISNPVNVIQRNDCGPFVSDVTGRVTCPEGLNLNPVTCWYCDGEGCPFCYMTGSMPACRECKGGRALIEEIIRSMKKSPEKTIEELEEVERIRWAKRQKAYINV